MPDGEGWSTSHISCFTVKTEPWYPFDRKLGGPQSQCEQWEKIMSNLRLYITNRNIIDFFFPRKSFVVFGVAEFKEYCTLDEVYCKMVIRTRLQLFIFQGS